MLTIWIWIFFLVTIWIWIWEHYFSLKKVWDKSTNDDSDYVIFGLINKVINKNVNEYYIDIIVLPNYGSHVLWGELEFNDLYKCPICARHLFIL